MNLVKLGLTISLIAGSAFANASEYNFGIQGGVGFGGDKVIASGTTTETITAGDSFTYGVFINTPILFSDVYGKVAISVANESETYTDAEESFSRMPLSFLLMKKAGSYSYGAGLTYHLNPSYELSLNSGGSAKIDYDSAIGFIIEANKTLSSGLELGVSYTKVEYSGGSTTNTTGSTLTFNETVAASNFAITLGYTF